MRFIWKKRNFSALLLLIAFASGRQISAQQDLNEVFVQLEAKTPQKRTEIANLGVALEEVDDKSVWIWANPVIQEKLKPGNYKVLKVLSPWTLRFPETDQEYHDPEEILTLFQELYANHSDLLSIHRVGQSVEGKPIWAAQINSDGKTKPGSLFMGSHHAREHLSTEVPLLLLKYLLENRNDPKILQLLTSRDIWIIPLVNPDGKEWDTVGSRYHHWRKNRRKNTNGTYGVDLNRNYSFHWGEGGASTNPGSDVYQGEKPFSEPETRAIRDLIESNPNIKTLITFHSFSELILYPWGHTYDKISDQRDHEVFKTLAEKMASWNGYTPKQSSGLYIASGDTVDWAYGEKGIFAFTFELSPKSIMSGGFYPGPQAIQKTFQANLKPCLYLIEVAADPYQVLDI